MELGQDTTNISNRDEPFIRFNRLIDIGCEQFRFLHIKETFFCNLFSSTTRNPVPSIFPRIKMKGHLKMKTSRHNNLVSLPSSPMPSRWIQDQKHIPIPKIPIPSSNFTNSADCFFDFIFWSRHSNLTFRKTLSLQILIIYEASVPKRRFGNILTIID